MTEKALHKVKLVYYTLEHLLGPVLVFLTCYLHHLYFVDDFVSSFFAGFALVSLLLVMALERFGLFCAGFIQLAFLGWVALAGPQELLQQILFSASLAISLIATYVNLETKEAVSTPAEPPQTVDQKQKLWQELFDARQEIKTLYQQKQELEAAIQDKMQQACRERDEKLLFLQHHLEAVMLEKAQLVEAKHTCEDDIKKLLGNMHEMALRNQQMRDQVATLEQNVNQLQEKNEQEKNEQEKKEQNKQGQEKQEQKEPVSQQDTKVPLAPYEAMYIQLKKQFEEKAETLDETRKQLFSAEEQIELLLRTKNEQLEPTEEERALMKQLVKIEKKLDALKKKHQEELIGYEEVIQGLLTQLQAKSNPTP